MTLNEVAQRYGNKPGYRLADAVAVALPVYDVNIEAIVIAKKKIALTDEFLLRAVEGGISSGPELSGFLGLEEQFVIKRIARLASEELLRHHVGKSDASGTVEITAKGSKALASEAQTIRPRRENLRFLVDGITRKPITSFAGVTRTLIQPKQAHQWGLMEIRAFPNSPPDNEELRRLNITEALPARARKEQAIHQVMEVVKMGPRFRRLREGVMLVFHSDTNPEDVTVNFFIDGRPATEIDQAFINGGGIAKYRLAEQVAKSRKETEEQLKADGFWPLVEQAAASENQLQNKLEPTLQKIGEIAAETKLEEEKLADQRSPSETAKLKKRVQELEQERERLEQEIRSIPVRHLRMHEHRPLFEKCLESANEHLLIISPWIGDDVLTAERLRNIECLLKRGTRVSIGYGFGDEGDPRSRDSKGKDAIKRLEALKRMHPKTMCFHRFGNTHEKILIKDSELAVIGSFNWMSFEGRSDGTIRCEASLMITHPQKVRELMKEFVARFPT